MCRSEHLDPDVVGGDDPVEAPFLAQDRAEELVRGMARHAVDIAVRGHHAGQPAGPDSRLEREQLLVAQLPRADVRGRPVHPALGESVADHVLAGGDHAGREIGPLQGANIGEPELGGEVRVLAVGLLDPAPARVATDVEDGTERMPRPGGEHPPADRRGDGGDEAGSNVAAAPIDCWKQGAVQASRPWRHSSWTIVGIPSLVSSTR